MPNYTYVCGGCEKEKELQRKISERHDAVCCEFCHTLMELGLAAPGFKVIGGTPKGGGRQK